MQSHILDRKESQEPVCYSTLAHATGLSKMSSPLCEQEPSECCSNPPSSGSRGRKQGEGSSSTIRTTTASSESKSPSKEAASVLDTPLFNERNEPDALMQMHKRFERFDTCSNLYFFFKLYA